MNDGERPIALFHQELIENTVRWAIDNCEFYRERYRGLPVPRSTSELSRLPLTWKHELRDAGWSARVRTLRPAIRQHTSGITAPWLELYRSQEELQFLAQLVTSVMSEDQEQGLRRLRLHLGSRSHGSLVPLPTPDFVLHANVHDAAFLPGGASRLLLDEHETPGVESRIGAISGGLMSVVVMSIILRTVGFDFSAARVTNISVTGDLLTPRWRRLLEGSWRCEIDNRFSLTEIIGSALYCGECAAFHFDPEIVVEVVDAVTHRPLDSGAGLLVLSALYPFSQMQPCIRYVTGDVVRIVPTKCGDNRPAYQMNGRLAHAWCSPEGEIVLPGRFILEAIEDEPLVARSVIFRDLHERFPVARELGAPKAELLARDGGAILRVQCQVDPLFYSAALEELRVRILGRLRPYIKPGFEDKLQVQMEGPGATIAAFTPGKV